MRHSNANVLAHFTHVTSLLPRREVPMIPFLQQRARLIVIARLQGMKRPAAVQAMESRVEFLVGCGWDYIGLQVTPADVDT